MTWAERVDCKKVRCDIQDERCKQKTRKVTYSECQHSYVARPTAIVAIGDPYVCVCMSVVSHAAEQT